MTLDEALLYDAEWWISDNPGDDVKVNVIKIRKEYGLADAYCSGIGLDWEWHCYFNLLIREAIRND